MQPTHCDLAGRDLRRINTPTSLSTACPPIGSPLDKPNQWQREKKYIKAGHEILAAQQDEDKERRPGDDEYSQHPPPCLWTSDHQRQILLFNSRGVYSTSLFWNSMQHPIHLNKIGKWKLLNAPCFPFQVGCQHETRK